MDVEKETKSAMQAAIEHFKQDLKTLRTGRANPAILDHVKVDVYNTPMSLKSLANITVPEPRQLLITPFDRQNCAAIAKAIEAANLNVQTQMDHNVVRVLVPPMDESVRKEMVKECKKRNENAKIVLREVRRKFNDQVKKEKTGGDLSEDGVKRLEKKIQELTDHFCKECDQICSAKEKEILEI
jgi:ribosome recycling factor